MHRLECRRRLPAVKRRYIPVLPDRIIAAKEARMSPAELIALHASPSKDDGFYIVLIAGAFAISEPTLTGAAAILKLKPSELNRIFETGLSLPLSRLSTRPEADQIKEELQALGIDTVITSAAELQLDSAPKKIRALEISDEGVTTSVAASAERPTARWEDVTLLVAGRLIINRVEVEQRRKRGRNQSGDSRQLSSDETILDVYFRSEPSNWRIAAGNFDFSCLGATRSVTAYENFTALINMFRECAASASFDDAYGRTRTALATVWPVEPQIRTGEWRRSGAGKYDLATVTVTDNERQFTRYSRLRHWLKLRELESER